MSLDLAALPAEVIEKIVWLPTWQSCARWT